MKRRLTEFCRRLLGRWFFPEIAELEGRLKTCHGRMQEMYWDEKEKQFARIEVARLRQALEGIRQDGIENPGTQRGEVFVLVDQALSYGQFQGQAGYLSWIAPGACPVVREFADREVVFAKNQPEYHPLPALVSAGEERQVMSRWAPDPSQRLAIANGADLFVVLATFGKPLQPIMLGVGDRPSPEFFADWFGSPAVPS